MVITYIFSKRLEDQFRVQLRFRDFSDAINRLSIHRANLLDIDSFIQNTPDAQKTCAESDILVIYRYLYGPILSTIQYWKAREKKVIVEFDQAINYLSPELLDYSFWIEGVPLTDGAEKKVENRIDPAPLEQFKWGLGMVDAAIVPSARLANDWLQYTNIYEIPDYINSSRYPTLEKPHTDQVWLGLGQDVQFASFKNSGLSTAIESICRECPQVSLILCGQEKLIGEGLNIDPSQIKTYSPNNFYEWVNLLLKLDIGLVPIYGDYDLRLSRATLLDFMISKTPWIVTKQSPFASLSKYGSLVQNSVKAWKSEILKVMEQLEDFRREATREPFLFALGQDISVNIDKVLLVYSAILNQSPQKDSK